jgi:hypothetical protein
MLWIAGVGVLTGMYVPATAVFLNGALGSDTWTVQWQFWFLEALVWSVLASVALLAVPQLYRLERRAPWEFALGVLGVGLALRFALVGIQADPLERYSVRWDFWFFALGWAAAKASGHRQRLVVTLVALLSVPGFFGSSAREALVVAGFLLLLWLPGVHAPRRVNRWSRRSPVRRCTST